jgi:hypothetical protein
VRIAVGWAWVLWLAVGAAGQAAENPAWFTEPAGPSVFANPGDGQPYALTECPVCHGFGGCCDCGRVWEADVGVVYLQRSQPRDQTLIADAPPPFGTELLNAKAFDFDPKVGPLLRVARDFGPCKVEAKYFCVESWEPRVGPIDAPNGAAVLLPTPVGVGGVDFQLTGNYESDLHSLEFNFTRPTGDPWGFIIGYRHVQLDENLWLYASDQTPPPILFDVRSNARNRLDGFQVGLGGECPLLHGRLRLEGSGKAGIYANCMYGSTAVQGNLGENVFEERLTRVAFVGEAEAAAVFQVTRHVALRAGYQVTWLEGVALAAPQVDQLENGALDHAGGVLYHGANASLQFTW